MGGNFNPRSPCGERRYNGFCGSRKAWRFQSTLPVRGATIFRALLYVCDRISIHAPRAGSDLLMFLRCLIRFNISIHAPRAGSDMASWSVFINNPISIHAPRAGSDGELLENRSENIISIHAPRAGSDGRHPFLAKYIEGISIHAPRAGSDKGKRVFIIIKKYFNPRSPCGERQYICVNSSHILAYFNPRSPCGERPVRVDVPGVDKGISIHAPRAGSDYILSAAAVIQWISIHAPRAGSDESRFIKSINTDIFQSTLPVRGATFHARLYCPESTISIHAPRAGSDGRER